MLVVKQTCTKGIPTLAMLPLLLKIYFYFIRMNISLPICMCFVYVPGSQKRPEEVIRFLEIGVKDGCESPCELWDLNLGLPERAASALLVSTSYFTIGSEITNT